MTSPKLEDIGRFYDLLGHKKETEIRVFQPTGSVFVHSKSEFIEKVKEFNEQGRDVYAGLNERIANGTHDDEVSDLGLMLIDFDAHEGESLEECEKTAKDLLSIFKNADIYPTLDFSGRGYHLLLPSTQIALNDENRNLIKKKIDKFKNFLVNKFNVDSKTFNYSRICRITGTINQKNGKVSEFIEFNGRQPNDKLWEFINKLPDKEQSESTVEYSKTLEPKRECRFFDELALQQEFPHGSRHTTLAKNLSVYSKFTGKVDVRNKFIEKQRMGDEDFVGWDKKVDDGELSEFNCGEIVNYCKMNNLKDVCSLCPYNNFKFNDKKLKFSKKIKKANFLVKKLLFQDGKEVISENKDFHVDHDYYIYEIQFSVGENPKFLIVLPNSSIRAGDNVHYVTKLVNDKNLYDFFVDNPPTDKICKELLKKLGKSPKQIEKTENVFEELLKIDSSTIGGLFVSLSYGVSKNEIFSLSNEDCRQIIEDYTTLGLSVDSRIILSFRADFMIPDLLLSDFALYQFYNSHKILFTGTKAGKTTISTRIGHNSNRSTAKNLLGFSTSEQPYPGTLHHNVKPFYFDELQESLTESIYGTLLSYMELGTINTDVGAFSVNCSSLSSLSFMGNPKGDDKDDDSPDMEIANQFNKTITILTNNYSALGSRFGFILFDSRTKRISGTSKFVGHEFDILQAKYDMLRKFCSSNYSLMLRNEKIINFLNTEYDEQYLLTLKNMSEKSTVKSIKDFILGHTDSYRHCNGMALKLACTDFISDIINDCYKIDLIIEKAKEYRNTIIQINFSSMFNLVQGKSVREFYSKHFKKSFDEDSEQTKVILDSIYRYRLKNKDAKRILVVDLIEYFKESKYLVYELHKVLERMKPERLLTFYKIEYQKMDSLEFFTVNDSSVLELIFGNNEVKENVKIILPSMDGDKNVNQETLGNFEGESK